MKEKGVAFFGALIQELYYKYKEDGVAILLVFGAGDGNRTHIIGLGSRRSATELHPLSVTYFNPKRDVCQEKVLSDGTPQLARQGEFTCEAISLARQGEFTCAAIYLGEADPHSAINAVAASSCAGSPSGFLNMPK